MGWLLLVLGLPVFIHLPELTGLIWSDPLLLMSGLGVDVPSALLPGQPGWIDGNAGVTTEALGRLVARDWMHGIVPWWNPYSGIGVPLAGEYQPAAFFLPFVLLLGLPNGVLLLKLVLQMVAAAGGWGLGRRLGFCRPVAATVAIACAFNGAFAWASDAPIQPMAFLPSILLGVELARRPSGSWLPLGLGLGLSLLAGFPETAFLGGLLALGWALLRLVGAGAERIRLALRLGLAGVFALLLAGPQLAAFLDFLPDAFVGSHGGLVQSPLPAAGFVMWLMPWLHGPMFFAGQGRLWFTLGGYCGAAPVLLALCALLGRRERALRLLLAGWVALVVGKDAELPLLSALADAIPLMGHTVVSRYATPSAGLAIILLAGFALEDWRRSGCGLGRRRRIMALGGFGTLVVVCLLAAWPVTRSTLQVPDGALAALLSAGLLVSVTMFLSVWLGSVPDRRRLGAAVAVVALEALLLFTVPLFSGRSGGHLDDGTLSFLRDHLGTGRVTTVGSALTPNYGAYWGLASINHNLVPVPRAWTTHVQTALDPAADPIEFYGADDGNMAGIERRADALRPRIAALEALGVRYILQDHGADHFAVPAVPTDNRSDNGWHGLNNGETLYARYPAGRVPALDVVELSVVIGTFVGHSSGMLSAILCSGTDCAHGSARLDTAADNAALPMTLDRTLHVRPDRALTLVLAHPDGAPVAIWLWHGADGDVPRLALRDAATPRLVHAGAAADIYALPYPAPYAEAGTGCTLVVQSRTRMIATCAAPGRLLRRELFLRGWQVRIGATGWRPVQPAGALFQAVALPAGCSVLRFAYAPPHATAGWCALSVAAAMAAATGIRGRFRRRPRTVRGLHAV